MNGTPETQTTPRTQAGHRGLRGRKKEALGFYLYIAPWFICLIIFTLLPMVLSLVMSFTTVRVEILTTRAWKFVRFMNYHDLFTSDRHFVQSIFNTLMYAVSKVGINIVLAMLVAMLLNKQNMKGRKLFRVLVYLPAVIPSVSTALLWKLLILQDRSYLLNLMTTIGLPKMDFGRQAYAMPTVLFINSLGVIGPWMIVLLAALQGVPQDVTESARLEGASPLRMFFAIILPMILPSVFFLTLTGFINTLQAYEEIYLLIGENPYTYTMTMGIVHNAFDGYGIGYASAQAWIVFIIISVFAALYFGTMAKRVYYSGE
jgi:multiple sugar transport system permease protein